MSKSPYKAVIFDFLGVVCSEISPFWFQEYFAEKGKELRNQYMPATDRGELSQQQLFQELAALANVSPEEIEKDWIAHAHFNTELIALIKELRNEHKIGMISNAMSPFFHTLMALSGTVGLFDAVIVSSEVGHTKPSRKIYEVALAELGVEPHESIFIDDNRDNVKGAEKAGMAGHRYTSVEEVRALFQK